MPPIASLIWRFVTSSKRKMKINDRVEVYRVVLMSPLLVPLARLGHLRRGKEKIGTPHYTETLMGEIKPGGFRGA